MRCKTGETVINLKKKLHDEFEIPFHSILHFNDQVMIDPLSLNDFPALIQGVKDKKPTVITIQH